MNERIRELYTEASEWALHNYPPPVNPFEWEKLRSEKFAELIVKECAKLVKNTQVTKDGHTWRSADRVVLEHFGVDK